MKVIVLISEHFDDESESDSCHIRASSKSKIILILILILILITYRGSVSLHFHWNWSMPGDLKRMDVQLLLLDDGIVHNPHHHHHQHHHHQLHLLHHHQPLLGAPCSSPTTPRAEAAASRDSSCSCFKLTWTFVFYLMGFWNFKFHFIGIFMSYRMLYLCYAALVVFLPFPCSNSQWPTGVQYTWCPSGSLSGAEEKDNIKKWRYEEWKWKYLECNNNQFELP